MYAREYARNRYMPTGDDARALFPLRYPSASDPGYDAHPEALTNPTKEDAEEE
jgi:hypothetical protein